MQATPQPGEIWRAVRTLRPGRTLMVIRVRPDRVIEFRYTDGYKRTHAFLKNFMTRYERVESPVHES